MPSLNKKALAFLTTLIFFSQQVTCQQERVFCDPEIQIEFCSDVSDPVCAFPTGCEDPSCSFTATNPCTACSEAGISFYYPGECPSMQVEIIIPVEEIEEVPIEPPLELLEIDESSSTCPPLGVVVYIGGKFLEGNFCCRVGDQPICRNEINPVCGSLFRCIGSLCRQTKRNSCQACEDPNVNVYFPGTCREIFGEGDPEAILEEEEEEEEEEETNNGEEEQVTLPVEEEQEELPTEEQEGPNNGEEEQVISPEEEQELQPGQEEEIGEFPGSEEIEVIGRESEYGSEEEIPHFEDEGGFIEELPGSGQEEGVIEELPHSEQEEGSIEDFPSYEEGRNFEEEDYEFAGEIFGVPNIRVLEMDWIDIYEF